MNISDADSPTPLASNDCSNDYPQAQVTDPEEILAVWDGQIAGDYYASDDETWANVASLAAWRKLHLENYPKDAPVDNYTSETTLKCSH